MSSYTTVTLFALLEPVSSEYIWLRPGQAVVARGKREVNQVTTLMESGREVVTTMSPNVVHTLEFTFRELAKDDETVDALTIAGFDSLRAFIEETVGYRGTEIRYKPKGRGVASFESGWYVSQSDFTYEEVREGFYNAKLTIRKVA